MSTKDTYTLVDRDSGTVLAGGTLDFVVRHVYGLGQLNPDRDFEGLVVLQTGSASAPSDFGEQVIGEGALPSDLRHILEGGK